MNIKIIGIVAVIVICLIFYVIREIDMLAKNNEAKFTELNENIENNNKSLRTKFQSDLASGIAKIKTYNADFITQTRKINYLNSQPVTNMVNHYTDAETYDSKNKMNNLSEIKSGKCKTAKHDSLYMSDSSNGSKFDIDCNVKNNTEKQSPCSNNNGIEILTVKKKNKSSKSSSTSSSKKSEKQQNKSETKKIETDSESKDNDYCSYVKDELTKETNSEKGSEDVVSGLETEISIKNASVKNGGLTEESHKSVSDKKEETHVENDGHEEEGEEDDEEDDEEGEEEGEEGEEGEEECEYEYVDEEGNEDNVEYEYVEEEVEQPVLSSDSVESIEIDIRQYTDKSKKDFDTKSVRSEMTQESKRKNKDDNESINSEDIVKLTLKTLKSIDTYSKKTLEHIARVLEVPIFYKHNNSRKKYKKDVLYQKIKESIKK